MNRDEVLKSIGENTICTVKFMKKNGEMRTLNGRLGVKKALKGGQKAFDDADYNLITIYDLKAQGYRSFNVDRLVELKAHGETYKFGEG